MYAFKLLTSFQTQSPNERLDIPNYEAQLIRTLEAYPSLAERHNRDLVPLFLAFASPDVPQRPQRQRLVSWLSLFAKFSNPRAVHSTSTLQRLYTSLLSHPDRQLQSLAMDCTLTYKSRSLLAHEKMIRSLLDQSEWKDCIVSLKLAETVQPNERAEVVDLLIRLFFGMMRERKGRNQIHGKRGTLLRFLAQCSDQELGVLVDLMIEPLKFNPASDADIPSLVIEVTDKQQTGFLVLLADVLKHIGCNLVIWWPKLLKATMAIVLNAQETLDKAMELDVEAPEEDETAELEEQDDPPAGASLPHKVARNIRQLGMKRLVEFARLQATFDFRPYLPAAFRGFISPRLPALDRENTQAPSTLLELFYVWSSNPSMRLFLVDYDDRVLPKVYQCLTAPSVKRPVVSRVFDIIEQILDGAKESEEIASRMAKPHMALLLDHLTIMVENTARTGVATSELSHRQIRILSAVASYVSDAPQASRLVYLLSPLLRKPTRVVAEKLKVDLLYIIQQLLPLLPQMTDATDATSVKTYDLLAYLFQTLRTRQSRLALVSAFSQLANYDSSLQRVAPLVESLNSYSERRHEEPDFERRLQAYALLNEQLYGQLSPREWLPLIYNMLFFIHEAEEVAIRNNAAFTLRRFINVVASKTLPDCEIAFNRVLWPGLKNGMRAKNDMVRGEILGVLGYAVTHCDHLPSLREMSVLLANGDEEANFFNNVHHIQVHRRTRALRRLAEYCEQGHIRGSALADVFLPLISHFIGDSSIDHTLVNEAITTTGKIARHLAWGPYYTLVQRYLRKAKEKNANEKTFVRTVVSVLDNFHFVMGDVVQQPVEEMDVNAEEEIEVVPSISTRIADAVTSRLLPSLLTYLEKRDETEDEVRILVSTGVVRVALHLPEESRQPQVSRLLTILSQALRSKSQDTRNLVRETLCKIAMILGPDWLRPLIKELRLALTRGPQLHVLAYTCHSILVHVTNESSNAFTHLDDAAEDVAEVSAEVIFGQSGRDSQGEDFKTTVKEVRGAASKALDSFALIAKHIAPHSITRLLTPLKSIMHETEVLKVMNQVEDILRRISSGLNSNPYLTPPELLVLCHSLISQNAKFLQAAPRVVEQHVKGGKKQFIVQTKRDLPTTREHYANNSFRFVAFGLDLVVTAFRRSKFDFHDEGIISRLEPMVPIIGNTLYSTASPVVILGLKAAAAILKAPLKAAGPAVSVVCGQCIQIVRQAGGTESEIAQTALKSLAIILRECPTAELKERDLSFLLGAVSPDLEEPERQAAVFALLRALVVRKFVVPEIYDMMEQLAGVMVTSQSPQVQELCRSVLLQFLLDYPQGKGRLRKQMSFLASNLSYIFESGRHSVMEILGAILTKFDSALIKEYGELFWVALVMVIANDDSAKCRERAAELIKSLYRVLDDIERRKLLDRTHVWAQQAGKILDAPEGKEAALARVAAQLYGLMAEVLEQGMAPYLTVVMEDLNFMTAVSSRLFASIAEGEESRMEDGLEWRLGYHALTVLSKLAKYFPELLSSDPGTEIPMDWASVVRLMLSPHSWVRIASSRLLGSFYATLPTTTASFSQDHSHPASIPGMILVAQNSCIQLKGEHVDEAIVLQVVKNLAWLGRAFSVLNPRSIQDSDDSSSEREAGDDNDDDSDNGDVPSGDERVTRLKRAERSPLPWLFSKLSYQIKTALIQRRNSFSTRVSSKSSHCVPTQSSS
jgi:U3 small nucleolar RNA-associated protein 20